MSTSGTERGGYLPFLGDGIAQSFSQIPLNATPDAFDLTPGQDLFQVRARGQHTAFSAPTFFAPFTSASASPTDVAMLAIYPATARGPARVAHLAPSVFPNVITPDAGPTDVAMLAIYPSVARGWPATAHRAPYASPNIITPDVATPTDVAMLAIYPPTARGWTPTAHRAPFVFPNVIHPTVVIPAGPTDVASLTRVPDTAPGRAKTSHRAPSYFAPVFVSFNPGASHPQDLVVAPTLVRGRVPAAHRMQSAFAPAAPLTGGTAPGPVITGLESDNAQRFIQTLRYWTDVQRSRDGHERRAANIVDPRESWQASYVMDDASVDVVRAALFTDPVTHTYLPAHHESVPSQNQVTSTVVNVDGTYCDWIYIGSKILLLNSSNQWYGANVVGIAGSGAGTILQIDMSPPIGQTYGVGTRVAPLRRAHSRDSTGIPRWANSLGRWDAIFDLSDIPTAYGTGARALVTFDGLTVLDVRPFVHPDTSSDQVVAQDNLVTHLESIDNVATFENRWSLTRPYVSRQHDWTIHSPAERQYWKNFLQTVRGKQKIFLMATWRDDLSLNTQPAPGATTLIINNSPDYLNDYYPSLAHRRLQLEHADGTVEYAVVTGAFAPVPGQQVIQLQSGVTGTAIARVSILEQVRLDNDEINIEWRDRQFGIVTLPMTTVIQ